MARAHWVLWVGWGWIGIAANRQTNPCCVKTLHAALSEVLCTKQTRAMLLHCNAADPRHVDADVAPT